MIHEAVLQINNALNLGLQLEGITNISANEIAEVAIVNQKGSQKSFPALFDVNGEGKYPFLDDKFDLGFYHRVNVNRYLPNYRNFGRNKDRIVESDMMLVVWGFSKPLQLSKYQVEEIVRKAFPDEALLLASSFDSLQIFNREFKGYKFNIRPEEFVFSIQYKVRYPEERC
ncbi:hypothetical protein [Proteiniphilum sp. X52]|uniref:hypothetical protein n=1 Tax=Proteiniphilum sp. X52 TaxID=2382159 RepID=UPI000F0A72BA|nr:hypothetical protein [Proteiniphilum sp. X52]RNC66475.1 hypothetical protein D7D25_03065 [Proteiniphilum sp. X52]